MVKTSSIVLLNLKNSYPHSMVILSFRCVGSQMPELDQGEGAFLLPPPYKIGSQNTPYQSIQLLSSLPQADPQGIFLRWRNPIPQAKKAAEPQPLGQEFTCRKAPKPHPRDRTRLKKLIKDIRSKGREMGIGIKQHHLLRLKYSLHISEAVFRIVVLIRIDTCI